MYMHVQAEEAASFSEEAHEYFGDRTLNLTEISPPLLISCGWPQFANLWDSPLHRIPSEMPYRKLFWSETSHNFQRCTVLKLDMREL